MQNASSKEEGHLLSGLKLYKSINLIGVEDYDLEDSDDESTVVSPLAYSLTLPKKGFGETIMSMK
jgi:hypothetical protein